MAPVGDLGGLGAPASPDLRVSSPARTGDVTGLRHRLTTWIASHHPARRLAGDIELATYEALINAAEHAYPTGDTGDVVLFAHHSPGLIRVTVTDFGHWERPAITPGPLHGRGLVLIRVLTDDATITSTEAGTTVTLTWYLHTDGT
jgi:serine/threonine-protein kinase RsbW